MKQRFQTDFQVHHRSMDETGEYFVFVNTDDQQRTITIADHDLTKGTVVVDNDESGTEKVLEPTGFKLTKDQIVIEPLTAVVIKMGGEDDAEPVIETPADLLTDLNDKLTNHIKSGDIRGPLVNQLSNTIRQAIHHEKAGRDKQAIKFMGDFQKHMDRKANDRHIDVEVKAELTTQAEKIIQLLQSKSK